MCGIAGYLSFTDARAPTAVLEAMTRALAHRGPDGEGLHTDGRIGLGHRRLAILDLTAAALFENPALSSFSGRVSDSGEGRWTITAAIEESAPAPVLTAALYQRFISRGEDDFAERLLSAMRFQFGGHVEQAEITGGKAS